MERRTACHSESRYPRTDRPKTFASLGDVVVRIEFSASSSPKSLALLAINHCSALRYCVLPISNAASCHWLRQEQSGLDDDVVWPQKCRYENTSPLATRANSSGRDDGVVDDGMNDCDCLAIATQVGRR
jgi:hypothetical protein